MKKEPKVSIVVVNYNGKKDTFDLIESLKKIDYRNYEIIVVDNASKDKIYEEFNKRYSKKRFILIKNNKNLGLAEGTNIGIRKAIKDKSDYILTMNNDMYVKRDFLKILVKLMEAHSEVAVAGPKIYYTNPDKMIWCAGCKYRLQGYKPLQQGEIDNEKEEKDRYVDGLDCVLIFRTDCLKKIGLLNPKLFLIHEFTEWCLRTTNKGYKCLYVPTSIVWHKVNSTLEKEKNKNELTTYYSSRNWLFTIKDNKNILYFLLILFLQATLFAAYRFINFLRWKKPILIIHYYLGIWHAIIDKAPMRKYPYS